MKHYAFTSHIDNTTPKHTIAQHNNQHKPQSLYPTEESGNPKRPRDHKTMLPHPNEPQPTDDPKGRTKRPSDRPMEAQKTIGKKIKHNNNHPNPQHLQRHHNYHMHPTWQPQKDGHNEKHTNNALRSNSCWNGHPSSSTSEIMWNNRSRKLEKTIPRPPEESNRTAQKSLASLTLPHRHWTR